MYSSQKIFYKLRKKTSALFALVYILLISIIALLAYVLAPDNSPNANTMILELSAKPAGFKTKVLALPITNRVKVNTSLWQQFLFGKVSENKYVPITQYWIKDHQLLVKHYIDEGLSDVQRYPLQDILPKQLWDKSLSEQKAYLEKHRIKEKVFYLGTDRYGRDILSRLIIGSRVSIAVGFVAVFISLSIGIFMGAVAGYYGKWTDTLLTFFLNIFWAIPTLLLVFALSLSLGKSFLMIFIAIGFTMWVGPARLIRGQVMALKEMDYIKAAEALGASNFRIITHHILPNIVGSIMVLAAANFAAAILIEAGLSFLGIGLQPPQPSWGLMIKEHYNFIITQNPMAALVPGIAIMLLVYAFNILGNALRDIIDVKA